LPSCRKTGIPVSRAAPRVFETDSTSNKDGAADVHARIGLFAADNVSPRILDSKALKAGKRNIKDADTLLLLQLYG
jgi:hypothetical protein